MMRHLVVRLSVAVLLAAAVSCATVNRYVYVAMRGAVRDQAGRPISSVQVLVVGTGIQGVTNDSGQFELTGTLAAGISVLRAQYIGYAPAERKVKVREGGVVNVAPFTLKDRAIPAQF